MPPRGRPTGDPALKTAARTRCLRTVRARGARNNEPCGHCGKPIDYTLKHQPGKPHPWAFVGDEIQPRHLGGNPTDPNNVRPSHHRCNAQAGVAITNAKKRARGRPTPTLVNDDW